MQGITNAKAIRIAIESTEKQRLVVITNFAQNSCARSPFGPISIFEVPTMWQYAFWLIRWS